jgi:hypothetical protein
MAKALSIIKPETISEICRDIAQVFFAAMFVEQIALKTTNFIMMMSGLVLSIGFWYASLLVVKR